MRSLPPRRQSRWLVRRRSLTPPIIGLRPNLRFHNYSPLPGVESDSSVELSPERRWRYGREARSLNTQSLAANGPDLTICPSARAGRTSSTPTALTAVTPAFAAIPSLTMLMMHCPSAVCLFTEDVKDMWMNAPVEMALSLQRPPLPGSLKVVATDTKGDGPR